MMMNLGKTPISEENPAGKDARYEADFEFLSLEIAKLSSPTASSGINWDTVIKLSAKILEKDSKHLQAASYLNYGLIKTKGLEGLYQGIHILKELIENFWETLFPPKNRMKGRKGIIVWWEEKVSDFVSHADPVTWKREKRDALIDELTCIDIFLGENMEDAPLLLPLIKRIKDVVVEEKTEETPKITEVPEAIDKPKKKPVVPVQVKKKADPEPLLLSDSSDVPALLEHGLNILAKAATGLKNKNPANPLSYRLNRIAAWATIDELPTAVGGKTMIPPPDEQVVSMLAGLFDSGDWEALVDSSEGRILQFLFWLDLSRYSAQGMEKMGYTEAARAIEAETALFIQTLKGIETLAFSDGTPFADAATAEWLKHINRKETGSPQASDSSQADDIIQIISQTMGRARQLIREKRLDTALGLFPEHLSKAASERERFLWKTGLCRLLIDSNQLRIASSYMDSILACIDTFNLEAWEPECAVDALELVLKGLRLERKEQHEPLIESVIKRISILDPVKALQII